MTTVNPPTDLPVPDGADVILPFDHWASDTETRSVGGKRRELCGIGLYTTAMQRADGTIVAEHPDEPTVGVDYLSPAFTSKQAREFAQLLIEAADEIDQWAAFGCSTCEHWDSCPRHPKQVTR